MVRRRLRIGFKLGRSPIKRVENITIEKLFEKLFRDTIPDQGWYERNIDTIITYLKKNPSIIGNLKLYNHTIENLAVLLGKEKNRIKDFLIYSINIPLLYYFATITDQGAIQNLDNKCKEIHSSLSSRLFYVGKGKPLDINSFVKKIKEDKGLYLGLYGSYGEGGKTFFILLNDVLGCVSKLIYGGGVP